MDETKTSLLSIEIDGGVARRLVRPGLGELESRARTEEGAPCTHQEWLLEELAKVARDYPGPEKGIEVYAYSELAASVRVQTPPAVSTLPSR